MAAASTQCATRSFETAPGSSRPSATRTSLLRVYDDSLLSYPCVCLGVTGGTRLLPEDPDRTASSVCVRARVADLRPASRSSGCHVGEARLLRLRHDDPRRPGTWEAARAAVDVGLTAVDLVLGGARLRTRAAARRAITPPCVLRRLLLPEQRGRTLPRLAERIGGPVAVLDIDAHHGNGTQELFYDLRQTSFVGSVHVDPGAGWFPHFLGFADEIGRGPARSEHEHRHWRRGRETVQWLAGVGRARRAGHSQQVRGRLVVLARGRCGRRADPESPLRVTRYWLPRRQDADRRTWAPTVLVQEGGYDLGTLGDLVVRRCSASRRAMPVSGVSTEYLVMSSSGSSRSDRIPLGFRVAGTPEERRRPASSHREMQGRRSGRRRRGTCPRRRVAARRRVRRAGRRYALRCASSAVSRRRHGRRCARSSSSSGGAAGGSSTARRQRKVALVHWVSRRGSGRTTSASSSACAALPRWS